MKESDNLPNLDPTLSPDDRELSKRESSVAIEVIDTILIDGFTDGTTTIDTSEIGDEPSATWKAASGGGICASSHVKSHRGRTRPHLPYCPWQRCTGNSVRPRWHDHHRQRIA